jgi:hypothetical protein
MKTRSGLNVKLLYTINDPHADCPIVAIITKTDGSEIVARYTETLKYLSTTGDHQYDIIDGTLISLDKKYKSRKGANVRVLCLDGPNATYPVIAIVDNSDLCELTPRGEYLGSKRLHRFDIAEDTE